MKLAIQPGQSSYKWLRSTRGLPLFSNYLSTGRLWLLAAPCSLGQRGSIQSPFPFTFTYPEICAPFLRLLSSSSYFLPLNLSLFFSETFLLSFNSSLRLKTSLPFPVLAFYHCSSTLAHGQSILQPPLAPSSLSSSPLHLNFAAFSHQSFNRQSP